MGRSAHPLFPGLRRRGQALGDRIRMARLRRRMSQADLAVRANVDRKTLARLEHGELTVSLELLLRVLGILGLDADVDQIAREDELGRRMQDAPLRRPVRRHPGGP